MGHFYPPPPPSQGPSASTPPLPHDPVPAQGTSVPPRRAASAMVAMMVVLASWPADLEPRLQPPNERQQKIAPLTLTYGAQPTPSAFYTPTELNQVVTSWPNVVGPLLPRPDDQQQKIAPLTLKYGSQPTPSAFLSPTELGLIAGQWPNDVGPLLARPNAERQRFPIVAAAGTIATTAPTAYHTYQQNGSNQADIAISGTYTGSPTTIEASFNGGAFATIVASPAGGTYAGTLTAQARGQGTLIVRFSNDHTVTASVSVVGIGDVFVCVGDSLTQGRVTNAKTTTANGSGIIATCWNGSAWAVANDPTNSGTTNGSYWPLVGTQLVAAAGSYPVAFINVGVGSSGLVNPNLGTNLWPKATGTNYAAMATAITNAAVVNPPKGFIVHLGANDSIDTSTESIATYKTAIAQLVSDLRSDYSGATIFWAQLGDVTTGSPPDRRAALDNIREAIRESWNTVTGMWNGPVLYDITPDDGVHYTSDPHATLLANRWSAAIIEKFYGGAAGSGRGPTVASISLNAGQTLALLTFNVPTTPLLPASGMGGYRVYDGGTLYGGTVTVTVVDATHVTLGFSPAIVGALTLSLGSGLDVADNGGANLTPPTDSSSLTLPNEAFIQQPVANQLAQPTLPVAKLLQIIGLWPATDVGPVLPRQLAPSVAMVLPSGQAPPPSAFLSTTNRTTIALWPDVVGPQTPWPANTPTRVATLTLPTGTTPTPRAPISVATLTSTVLAWQQTWDAQTYAKNAAINPPPILTHVPPGTRIPDAVWQQPPDPQPVQLLRSVVPALPSASQPIPLAPLSVTEIAQIVASWDVTWSTQSAPKSASWNVPPVLVQVPFVPVPAHVYAASQAPDLPPAPRLPAIASITPTGIVPYIPVPAHVYAASQPADATPPPRLQSVVATLPAVPPTTPSFPLSIAQLTGAVAAAAVTWDAQTAPKSAAWNIPSIPLAVRQNRLPAHLYAAWEPPIPSAQGPIAFVTVSGQSAAAPRVLRLLYSSVTAHGTRLSSVTVHPLCLTSE